LIKHAFNKYMYYEEFVYHNYKKFVTRSICSSHRLSWTIYQTISHEQKL